MIAQYPKCDNLALNTGHLYTLYLYCPKPHVIDPTSDGHINWANIKLDLVKEKVFLLFVQAMSRPGRLPFAIKGVSVRSKPVLFHPVPPQLKYIMICVIPYETPPFVKWCVKYGQNILKMQRVLFF